MRKNHSEEQELTPMERMEQRLLSMEKEYRRLKAAPFGHATVLHSNNEVDPKKFQPNDEVFVIDEYRIAQITDTVGDDGEVPVIFPDLTTGEYRIGLDGTRPEVQLIGKNDGTNVVILYDGKRYEVNSVPGVKFAPGQDVKIDLVSKQIISEEEVVPTPGEICTVKTILDDSYSEVEHSGQNRVVFNGRYEITPNDRVQLDHSGSVIVRVLGKENANDYTLSVDSLDVEWDDIGGCDGAKLALRQALEYPFQHPELYQFYKKKAPKGILLFGPTGCGKAQPISSTVYTPSGPMKMRDVLPGQMVCTPDGRDSSVISIHPQGKKDIYRIYFDDETFAECTLDHLWKVESKHGYKSGVMTTNDLISHGLKMPSGRRIYSIPMTNKVCFECREHIIHPYVMGVLLAEGCFVSSTVSVTICEKEVLDRFSKLLPNSYELVPKSEDHPCDYYITRGDHKDAAVISNEIRRLGLFGKLSDSKFIPSEYLYDSAAHRLELLRGLMDGDGTVSKTGHVTYSTASCKLADCFQFLIESIGGTCSFSFRESWYTYKGTKKQGKDSIRCNISVPDASEIMTLGYKLERVKARTKYFPKRMIDRIELIRQEEAQCILLEHPDHLYLTDHCIVTHNTMLVKAGALSVARSHGKKANKTGIIMVKGPELLSKWVGQAEERVRSLFKRGRDHFEEYGYPPLLVIDEAEAIVPTRGSGKSSDVENTIVPQFLSEMDGVESSPVIVILLTNRPDMIDPALTRVGRIDRHIKVPRPDAKTTKDIFKLHLRDIPLYDVTSESVAEFATTKIFDPRMTLYRIRSRAATKPLQFTFADCINGAIIKGIVDMATDFAVERDRVSDHPPLGVTKEDFLAAIRQQHKEQAEQNHQFDLQDFLQMNGVLSTEVTIERFYNGDL